MAFKLKHTSVESMLAAPKMYEEQPKNMENVLAGKDAAQGPMMYDKDSPKAMDEMHNGKPGVQQEDFKQFSGSGGSKSKGPHAEKEFTLNSGKSKQKKRGDDPSKITSGGSDGAKSKGPKSHETTKNGKVIVHGKEKEERENTIISKAEQARRAAARKKQEDRVTNNQ